MFDIKGKKVTVIGAQRSGLAALKLIAAKGGRPRLSELGEQKACPEEILRWLKAHGSEAEFGGHSKEFIRNSDLVVVSPGVPISAGPLAMARELGIPFLGEIEFAAQFCTRPIVAVTGSNGKTTVVNLIHQLISAGGHKSCLCGNVGFPFSEHVLGNDDYDFFVLEVSSFQMESLWGTEKGSRASGPFAIRRFQPRVAVLLNVTENHLDRHTDMQDYINAKVKIFANQTGEDFAVINGRDEICQGLKHKLAAQVREFNKSPDTGNPNFDAARTAAEILGIPGEAIAGVLRDFKGVEHRLEKFTVIDGVRFINDSKSTTPRSSQWALQQLEGPVIWICGGRDKNLNFDIGRDLVRSKVKCIIAIGEARQKIKSTFAGTVSIYEAGSLDESVQMARAKSSPGDCVLLSPMCASFDMFKNFEERGRLFKVCVSQLQRVLN